MHLDIIAPYQSDGDIMVSSSSKTGVLCAVECQIRSNPDHKLILIAIYISSNVSIPDIKLFLDKALLP